MHHNRQGQEKGQMLQRIVVLLCALADLAEAASEKSPVVCRLVLWLLYPAEAVARELVLDACGPVNLACAKTPFSSGGTEDALRLAVCFRVLAMLLDQVEPEMFAHGRQDWFDILGRLSLIFAMSICRDQSLQAIARPFPDTS